MNNKQEKLNELALFAGAGGGILGGHLLGWRTVCAVEWDAYAASVLAARQNDKILPTFPIWDDVQTFDGRPWRGIVDVVSGGFPCQDISAAGKGAGITGERSGMWSHMARIVGEVLPRFVYVENSPMLVSRGLALVISDLAAMGYDCRWGVLGAHHVGAPHKRDRIWLVANANGVRQLQPQGTEQDERGRAGDGGQEMANASSTQDHAERGDCECGRNAMGRYQEATQQDHGTTDHYCASGCRGNVADPEVLHAQRCGLRSGQVESGRSDCGDGGRDCGEATWWAVEPELGRVAYGVANRVDRLKAIGNGQVPAVAAAAWKILGGAS